ncbi:MAG TPA: hypothetical protein VFV87_16245 [Pirellulaceae bacterium]|nr:hypothetical protein [Pirellulaceae bacterium]
MLSRLKLWAINAFIATLLALMLIDTLPQSPIALRLAIQPVLRRTGLHQGPWNMFTPNPDAINLKLRAEVTYRDGQKAQWESPDWRSQPNWERWVGHRQQEFCDMIATQEAAPAWRTWAQFLARTLRPDFPNAERGAEVRITYQEAPVPPAEKQPWTTWREPPPYGDTWFLTIEKFP